MKLAAVKVYQAVEFRRKLETYFVQTVDRMVGLEISVFKDEGTAIGVSLKIDDDEIIVPFTNIAFMKVDLSEKDKKTKGREPKSGEQAPYRSR